MSKQQREVQIVSRFVGRCAASLKAVFTAVCRDTEPKLAYNESLKYVLRLLAVMLASERMPTSRTIWNEIQAAANQITQASQGMAFDAGEFDEDCRKVQAGCSLAIFSPSSVIDFPKEALAGAAQALLRPPDDIEMGSLFFQTMPLSWLGSGYQAMLTYKPSDSCDQLVSSRSHRKDGGVFFTPGYLVDYIIEGVLTPQVDTLMGEISSASAVDRLSRLHILDHSMGGADFLCKAVEFFAGKLASAGCAEDEARAKLAANCVYGADIDPRAVEISRFCIWCSSHFPEGISDSLHRHLVHLDVLSEHNDGSDPPPWWALFPEIFAEGVDGFDAVVGNPPYIASKNRALGSSSTILKGQSDSYLLFLREAMEKNLVRPGGMLSMVLPDPMLVRGNAAEVRRRLMHDWTLESVVHIAGAFSDAQVANVVPICRNCAPTSDTFSASCIKRVADRRSFSQRPLSTAASLAHKVRRDVVLAQKRCEMLYLMEMGPFGEVIRRIHGDVPKLTNYEAPFVPLGKLNIKSIYRGEEVGKSAISRETGDLRMLLGGQSIQPYEISWEGRRINRSSVKKPLERYASNKLLIQKSSPRLIAAVDEVSSEHNGYVFPQSVYAVELRKPGIDIFYLICLLNSEVMNEYIHRVATGYKLLQPQIELEDVRALPIRQVDFSTDDSTRHAQVQRGIELFEMTSQHYSVGAPYAELANYVTQCLWSAPEMSDVVHDLLVYLGKKLTKLLAQDKSEPGADVTQSLESTRAAIEAIVWRLYSPDPSQMSLPW